MSVVKTNSQAIIQAAHDLNYWGKKLLDKKRLCAGKIADQFTNGQHVSEIMDLLAAHQPTKATKAKEEKAPIEPVFSHSAHSYDQADRLVTGGQPVIIYAVQNNATICEPVQAVIDLVAHELDAITLPCRIGYIVDKDQDHLDHVAANVQTAPLWIDDYLVMAGEVIPTAKKPINHAKLVANGRKLTILPHVKQQAESLPKAKGSPEVWAVTTGAVTLPRYRQGRAGAEGHTDHCLGFTIVYPNGSFKQIQLDENGIGYHAGILFSPVGITDFAGGIVTLGDIHAEKIDPDFLAVTCAWLRDVAQPEAIVIEDLHDFTSRNHHNRHSGIFLAGQGDRTISDDLADALDVLDQIQAACPESMIYIVNSNHDRALDTWLDDPSVDPRKDPKNLPLWCDLQKARFLSAMGGEPLGVTLESALSAIEGDLNWSKIEFLREDQSLKFYGVEFGQHGDRGVNGAKGGPTAFEKLGSPYVIGHTHSGYKNGRRVAVAGVTGSLDMGYNKGASSWSQSHVFTGPDGIPQIVMGL